MKTDTAVLTPGETDDGTQAEVVIHADDDLTAAAVELDGKPALLLTMPDESDGSPVRLVEIRFLEEGDPRGVARAIARAAAEAAEAWGRARQEGRWNPSHRLDQASVQHTIDSARGAVKPVGRTHAAAITFTAAEIDTLMSTMMAGQNTAAAEERKWRELEAEGVTHEDWHRVFVKIMAADETTEL